MVTRACLICGAMICGCAECRSDDSLQHTYSLCDTCTEGVADRVGEQGGRNADATITTNLGDLDQRDRAIAKLEEWSHA